MKHLRKEERKVRKLKAILASILCLFMLAGCFGGANAGRGSDYKYDFIDYINIEVFGSNGNGYLQITPKEVSIYDFESEEEYIAVKKVLDQLSMYYIPGYGKSGNLKVSQGEKLKNGDMVNISISGSLLNSSQSLASSINMNVESYDYIVDGLKDPVYIDLFSEDNVNFYGLSTGEVVSVINENSTLPKELLNNIGYQIVPDSTPLKEGQTIMTIRVGMDTDFLTSGNIPYYTMDIYLSKNGFRTDYSTEKVLTTIVDPIDFDTFRAETMENTLFTAIQKAEEESRGFSSIEKVLNIQQLESQQKNDPYSYLVIYYDLNADNELVTYRRQVKMFGINDKLIIASMKAEEKIDAKFVDENYENAVRLMDFNY